MIATRVNTMTNRPPSDRESSGETDLGFDEFIAILVAFTTIGGIIFWSFSRKDTGWDFNKVLSPLATPSANVQPNNVPSPSPIQSKPNSGSNLNIPTSPDTDVVQPDTIQAPTEQIIPSPVLPPPYIRSRNSTQIQQPLDRTNGYESSVKSSPLPLVSPAKQKSTIPPPIAFNDVSGDFWASRFINVLSSRGIIKGFPDYTFRPNQAVNRAEFAAILQQAFEQEGTNSTISFQDVPAKSWAIPAINRAISTGFLKGYPNKIFKPEQKISRVQVLVALVSGLNLKEPAKPSQILSIYKDAEDIPKYATSKIAAATANNLVINYPDAKIFAPNREASRAEVAAMVHQALVQTGKLEKISSQSIVQLSQ